MGHSSWSGPKSANRVLQWDEDGEAQRDAEAGVVEAGWKLGVHDAQGEHQEEKRDQLG